MAKYEALQVFKAEGVEYRPGDSFPEEALRDDPVIRSALLGQRYIKEVEDTAVSPAAENRAEELNVPVEPVEPTGSKGEVLKRDVEEHYEPEATASAKEAAEELGVNLFEVAGSGKDGKVLKQDVEKYAAEQEK